MDINIIKKNKLYYAEGETEPFSGYHEEYWESGVLKETGDYKDGLKEGLWRCYFENGILFEVGLYKSGKVEGHWKLYFPDGQLSADLHFRDGKLDGYCEYFRADGSSEEIILYRLDEKIETRQRGDYTTKK